MRLTLEEIALKIITRPSPDNNNANHHGFPDSSTFGKFCCFSGVKYGSFEFVNAIETLFAVTFGLAERAINSFNSSIVVSLGKLFLSRVTAIEISSITPGLIYSFV